MSEAVFESAVVFLMSPFHTLGVCRYLYLWVCIDIQIDRQIARDRRDLQQQECSLRLTISGGLVECGSSARCPCIH